MNLIIDAKTRLQLLKDHSPDTYKRYVAHRTHEINSRLDDLRLKYTHATDDEKIRITDEANELKEELVLYD